MAVNQVLQAVDKVQAQLATKEQSYVILTSPKIRLAFRKLIAFNFPDLAVVSLNEVPNEITIEAVGMIEV